MGASGSGVTVLGRALATRLDFAHHDTDDYYWLPTSPPYHEKRQVADRLRLMHELFLDRVDWVLTGSLDGWGDPLIPRFDLVVFVVAPTGIRLQRLKDRETRHFGAANVAPGGWRHRETEEFLDWASHYEDGSREGRNRRRHEAWLAELPCRVLRLDGTESLPTLVDQIIRALGNPDESGTRR